MSADVQKNGIIVYSSKMVGTAFLKSPYSYNPCRYLSSFFLLGNVTSQEETARLRKQNLTVKEQFSDTWSDIGDFFMVSLYFISCLL